MNPKPEGGAFPADSYKQALAIDPQAGLVYIDQRKREFTVDLGGPRFACNLAGFQALVLLVNRAAANYELWLEQQEVSQ